ncbi:hypothetical protein [Rhizobium aegyptiacum]|uniref:hypothetical protein n=1 Tax=Rhizobium aegyptiacum TaxID=1764550 RepID=UPI0007E589BC|nr:hypothetical protein [Rhizobium aegyptiacum]
MLKKSIRTDFMELEHCYDELLWWRDVLQAIADFLPCHIEESLPTLISGSLLPLLRTAHELEERLISSRLQLIVEVAEKASAEGRRRASRLFDHDAARDVVTTLETLVEGRCRLSWEAVGFQLRSFFCSTRRHIRSEREIMEILQRAMEAAARLQEVADPTKAA